MTILELLEKYEPQLAQAFASAINEITSKAQIGQIQKALERGDIQGAIDAVYLDRGAFQEFERVLQQSYLDGGSNTISGLSLRDGEGQRFVVRFDARNFRAEQWLREHSSELVTNIVQEQQTIIRENLETGMRLGNNPRTTALDVVGRIDSRSGRRAGGVIGLSDPYAKAVDKARQELTEGDYSAYLQRSKRDQRFDAAIRKAMRNKKPLTADQIGKITGRYSDRLLKLRGDTIARTESLASLHAGQYESLKQLVESGKISANQVRRVWDATGDKRTRFNHAVADGQSVGLDEDFRIGLRSMRYPGDPRGGAEEVINCRCAVNVRIDYFANVQ